MNSNSNEKSIGYAIGKTNWYLKTLINNYFKKEGYNITSEQWFVLKVIYANPSMSQTELAEKSRKDKTNITRIIDLLEKHAYIERRRDEYDRRIYRINITENGKKILKMVNPVTQKTDKICIQSLNKTEVMKLIELLNIICKDIKKEL